MIARLLLSITFVVAVVVAVVVVVHCSLVERDFNPCVARDPAEKHELTQFCFVALPCLGLLALCVRQSVPKEQRSSRAAKVQMRLLLEDDDDEADDET